MVPLYHLRCSLLCLRVASICVVAQWVKIMVATSFWTGGSDTPPGCRIGNVRVRHRIKNNGIPGLGIPLFGAGDRTRFAFSPLGRKLRFASVKPSAATLVRVAFRWVRVRFLQRINPIVNVSFTMGFIGAGDRTRTGTLFTARDFKLFFLFGTPWNISDFGRIYWPVIKTFQNRKMLKKFTQEE